MLQRLPYDGGPYGSARSAPNGRTRRARSHGGLAMAGSVVHVMQDRSIYGEGDEAAAFFKVLDGVVRTCRFLDDGRRQIDGFHLVGDVFGLDAGTAYRLSAEAVCDCTLASYRRRSLEQLASCDAFISQQLFSVAMHGMARAQDHSRLLGRRSAVSKVAAFLIEWAAHSSSGEAVALAMTRQDIADYLGLTIETVSRTFSQLERDAVIELPTARQVRFKDLAALIKLNV